MAGTQLDRCTIKRGIQLHRNIGKRRTHLLSKEIISRNRWLLRQSQEVQHRRGLQVYGRKDKIVYNIQMIINLSVLIVVLVQTTQCF